jgi:hypothetical protein
MPQYGGRNPFELGQANGTFVLANATVDADAKEVHLKPLHNNIGIATVVAGRYYWQGFPLCVLYNGDGLPATPFFHTLKIDDDYVRVLCCAVFGDSRQPHILIQLLSSVSKFYLFCFYIGVAFVITLSNIVRETSR